MPAIFSYVRPDRERLCDEDDNDGSASGGAYHK